MKKTDLQVRILFFEILDCITKYKIVVPSFGAAYAAPNEGTTILY